MKYLLCVFIIFIGCATQYNPQIYSEVTTNKAIDLAEQFNLNDIVKRIRSNPGQYKSWVFDGCSGLVDHLLGLTGTKWQDITYKCCLPHDIEYAYGIPGDDQARLEADMRFYNRLIDVGVKPKIAKIFYNAVRKYGDEKYKQDFSWGFANVAHR